MKKQIIMFIGMAPLLIFTADRIKPPHPLEKLTKNDIRRLYQNDQGELRAILQMHPDYTDECTVCLDRRGVKTGVCCFGGRYCDCCSMKLKKECPICRNNIPAFFEYKYVPQVNPGQQQSERRAEKNLQSQMVSAFARHLKGRYTIQARELLEQHITDVNTSDNTGATPLIHAAASAFTGIVNTLINRGASVNVASNEGITPLHQAAQYSNINVLRLILARRPWIDAIDEKGRTPLMLAAQSVDPRILPQLINDEADVDARDNDNNSPLSYAVQYGDAEKVRRILEAHVRGCNAQEHGDCYDAEGIYKLIKQNPNTDERQEIKTELQEGGVTYPHCCECTVM